MKKTTVALQGFSDRAKTILSLYLSRRPKGGYTLVEGNGALNILDMDCINAQQVWESYKSAPGGTPTIVVSVKELNLENAVWLKKPLNLEQFTETLDRLIAEHQLNQLSSLAGTGENGQVTPIDKTDVAQLTKAKADISGQRIYISKSLQGYAKDYTKNTVENTSEAYEEKRSMQWFYGTRADVDYLNSKNQSDLYYTPDSYFQGMFIRALELAKSQSNPVQLSGGGVNFVFMQQGAIVYSETKSTLLHKMSFINIEEHNPFQIQALEHYPFLEQKLSRLTPRVSTELLWSLSLWSAKGRLPDAVSAESLIKIKNWPNFTRLDIPPHALEIVALWFHQETSISATATRLDVPYRAVYSVFSACYALGLIEVLHAEQPKIETDTTVQAVNKVSLPKRLFRALLNKLS